VFTFSNIPLSFIHSFIHSQQTVTVTVTMVDKELLVKKIKKVEGILDDIEEEKGSNNKLFRAYRRKLENYHDLLSDGSSDGDDNSTIDGGKGSALSLADSNSVDEPSKGGSVDIKTIKKKYKKVTKILEDLEDEHGEEAKERKDYKKFLKKKIEYAEVLGISEPLPEPGKHGKINIIIAGAPASGKGTQCEVIKEEFGVVHLSTGDMLRAAVAAKTDVGKKAKDYMDNGKLVPDEVIIGIVSIYEINACIDCIHCLKTRVQLYAGQRQTG
jgi:hypothetical protein